MAIDRWDPFRDFLTMQDEVGRMFERLYGSGRSQSGSRLSTWAPPIDVIEKDGEVLVRAELPGLDPEDVEVLVHDGTLVIKGERRFEDELDEEDFYRIERRYGSFERDVRLPIEIKQDEVAATFKNGVLEVVLPKAETAKPKQVKVSVRPETKAVEAKSS
ncbi:MAG: Hsp20/alpha crystallin family protein [Actinobacteria bacterium]|nr:MAG: Hsp20/alpha crystallin family protein [Actinomycetota bacterium]